MINSKARVLIDRDRLLNAPRRAVANATVSVFDRLQGFTKENQLLALACAFTLLASASGIPAQDVFVASKNLMADPLTSSGMGLQFQAMKYHLDTEMLAERKGR